MIVPCECGAKLKIDDAKIADKGAKVRCPRCGNVLSVKRPSSTPSEPPARIIPVVTATVQQKDMDVFINGLGTVTAFKTVTIRSRVDGELVKIAFVEGQMVRKGDLLAEIDSRPYKVQLQEAEAQLQREKPP